MKNTKRKSWFQFAFALSILVIALPTNAALVSRLDGLAYYDTELNITWLADANLAASNSFGVSGIGPYGSMTWTTAQSWVSAMNAYGGTGYLGVNDWRLPNTRPIDGTTADDSLISYIGTEDQGFNIGAPGTLYAGSTASEMAHLFHVTLANPGYCDPSTSGTSYCVGPQAGSGNVFNTGPFSNFMSYTYAYVFWSGTEFAPYTPYAWFFNFNDGSQYAAEKTDIKFALVVRPGDISPVPIPAAFWLFGSGLLALIGFGQRPFSQLRKALS